MNLEEHNKEMGVLLATEIEKKHGSNPTRIVLVEGTERYATFEEVFNPDGSHMGFQNGSYFAPHRYNGGQAEAIARAAINFGNRARMSLGVKGWFKDE